MTHTTENRGSATFDRPPARGSRTQDRPIGGQAVIEGVMIRSLDRIATAVRRPDGRIVVRSRPYVGLARRRSGFGLPVVRGIVSFGEMLAIGIETLNYSASIAAPRDDAPAGWRDRALAWLMTTVAIAIAAAVFVFLPLVIASAVGLERRAFSYNLIAGAARVTALLGYLAAIGRVGDIRRVFAYHGAEHQTIFAYEAGEEIDRESARRYDRFHPRCGTSFLLIVALLAIASYALIDSAFMIVFGRPETLVERLAVHLAFLPIVAGIAFEALKASGRYRHSRVVRALIAPGLWLQHLTTRPPDDDQLEVAVVAARASLGLPVDADLDPVPAG